MSATSKAVDRIDMPKPDDFHVHLRDGPASDRYARTSARVFGRSLVMPNTKPPLVSAPTIAAYRARLAAAAPGLDALMSFKLAPGMDADTVFACAAAGAIVGKYYPAGATTNSEDGIADPSQVAAALTAMEKAGLALSIHGEDPSAPVLEREKAFLPVVDGLVAAYPRLKIVLEHLSCAESLAFVLEGPGRLAATITAHHLLFDLDDLFGGGANPHLYCKPLLKTRADRDALREALFRGEEKLFFGSDSAPHPRAAKECGRAAAGVYSAPTALVALAQLFDEAGSLAALRPFVAGRGAAFYGLPRPRGRLVLERRPWTVPPEIDGAVPMLAGETLAWSVADSSDESGRDDA